MIAQKVPELLDYINANKDFIHHNYCLLDVYEGNLREHILKDMQASLSEEYFSRIKERVIPINVLNKLTDKMANSYEKPPLRVFSGTESDKQLASEYVNDLALDEAMDLAEEYSVMFKGYSLEPYIHEGKPKLRTLPYERFLPYSDDPIDPMSMTIFIKFVGEKDVEYTFRGKPRTEKRQVYYAFSKEEFYAFDERGEEYLPSIPNDIGEIPFIYANRGKNNIIPKPDSDIYSISKVIPVMMSDLSGTILFQCFSVIWGVDIDFENMKITPNALWSLKSDSTSDKTPQVGTIKPQADIDQVTKFIINTFTLWLDTKGIKAGAIGSLNGADAASGISKVIDEMDASSVIKKSMKKFKAEETAFWSLLKKMHNHWVATGQLKGKPLFSDDFSVTIEFDAPIVVHDRGKEFEDVMKEVDAGMELPINAIKLLYPRLDDEEVNERLAYYQSFKGKSDGMDESEDTDTEGLQTSGEASDSSGDN